jgi:hypothetical protein
MHCRHEGLYRPFHLDRAPSSATRDFTGSEPHGFHGITISGKLQGNRPGDSFDFNFHIRH